MDDFVSNQNDRLVRGRTPATKRKLKQFERALGTLIDLLREGGFDRQQSNATDEDKRLFAIFQYCFEMRDIDGFSFMLQLRQVRTMAKVVKEDISKSRRPPELAQDSLLFDMAELFVTISDGSLSISNTAGVRKSKFIDFVYEAIQTLPKEIRWSITRNALAARWERICWSSWD